MSRTPRLPPRRFIRLAWSVHRALYRLTRGRRAVGAEETALVILEPGG